MNTFRSLLLHSLSAFALMSSAHAVTRTGQLEIVVDGYVTLPTISRVLFSTMTMNNGYSDDSSQSQNYNIVTTFASRSTTPNISLQASLNGNHVDSSGGYLTSSVSNDRVYFHVNYRACGSGASTYNLVRSGSSPTPRIIIPRTQATPTACQTSGGQLLFIRKALPSASLLPAAGTYTGQLTLTAQATSETP